MKHLAILLLLSAFPALAADSSLSGTWKLEGNVGEVAVNLVCTFNQDGKVLNGSCQNSDKPDEKPSSFAGNIKDKTVIWKYDVDWNGSVLTVAYTGDWDGDAAMTGAIDVQPVNAAGAFTARKNK